MTDKYNRRHSVRRQSYLVSFRATTARRVADIRHVQTRYLIPKKFLSHVHVNSRSNIPYERRSAGESRRKHILSGNFPPPSAVTKLLAGRSVKRKERRNEEDTHFAIHRLAIPSAAWRGTVAELYATREAKRDISVSIPWHGASTIRYETRRIASRLFLARAVLNSLRLTATSTSLRLHPPFSPCLSFSRSRSLYPYDI